MAERQRTYVAPPKVEQDPLNQTHHIKLGDTIQLNGTLFTVPSLYEWKMVKPNGEEGTLMNPDMPGPSFVADEVGNYIVTLQTADGEATITVHVTE